MTQRQHSAIFTALHLNNFPFSLPVTGPQHFPQNILLLLVEMLLFLSLASRRRIVSHSSLISSVVLFPATLMYESMSVCVCVGGEEGGSCNKICCKSFICELCMGRLWRRRKQRSSTKWSLYCWAPVPHFLCSNPNHQSDHLSDSHMNSPCC